MFRKEIEKMYSCKDCVHVRCKISVPLEGQKNLLSYEFAKTNEVPKLNFEWIFLDESLSDVKLRTAGGKEIPAHRVVLAAASPVFKAMFSHDMLENKSQSVDMIDVSFETVVEFLRYIYTGRIKNNEITLSIELLTTSEKYQLELLKNACEKILSSTLSTENSLEMLKISDTYSANHLKKETVDFIKSHINGLSDVHEITNMILGKARSVSK
ncbi:hypothetical protein TKK_0019512 [Trichogramma kaykai]|uniref:BTB domain-containing protein n=1 Tax=Trichogramma kaykai TaxID=54128 RepID=A0ABD2VSJ3_9HYME